MELPDNVYSQIAVLSERGKRALDAGDGAGAIRVWRQALDLLPPPQQQWEAAMWLHASMGDAFRAEGNEDKALEQFQAAAASDGGGTNPFVQISLGATLYDLGRTKEARDSLLRAYMLEGNDIFGAFGGPYLDYLKAEKLVD